MAAPEDYPRNSDGTFVKYEWSETPDGAVEPSQARKDVGWVATDVVTAAELNWLDQTPARFARSALAEHPRASGGLVSSWLDPGDVFPMSEGRGTWSDTGVINPLEGFLSDAIGTATVAVDVWVDLGNGAKGLQVQVSLASPFLFTAISDNYVYLDQAEAVAGLGGGMTVLAVPNGNPAPPTPAGTKLFWIVITDAANITGQSIEVATIPAFKTIGFEGLGTSGNVAIDGDLDVDGTTMLKGPIEFDGDLFIRNKSRFRSHATTATWADDALVTRVTDASEANVPGGGGTAVTFTITAQAAPTRNQILTPADSLLTLSLVVQVSTADGLNVRSISFNSSWRWTAGVLTLLGDDSATALSITVGDAEVGFAPVGNAIVVTCGGAVGIAGTAVRCHYFAEGAVFPRA